MALAQNPNLVQLMNQELQAIRSMSQLPERDSSEALAIDDSLKPLRYALFSKAIDEFMAYPQQIVPGPGSEFTRAFSFHDLRCAITDEYHQRLNLFIDDPEQQELVETMKRAAETRVLLNQNVWTEPWQALSGGINTMVITSTTVLEQFSNHLLKAAVSPDARKVILSRSYNSIIEIAQLDALQLLAVTDMFHQLIVPSVSYEPETNKVRFERPITEMALSPEAVQQMGRWIRLDSNKPVTIGDISNAETVIGCPVLFKSGQVKKIWSGMIETADLMQLI